MSTSKDPKCFIISAIVAPQPVQSKNTPLLLSTRIPPKEPYDGAVRSLSTAGLVIKTISTDKYTNDSLTLLPLG